MLLITSFRSPVVSYLRSSIGQFGLSFTPQSINPLLTYGKQQFHTSIICLQIKKNKGRTKKTGKKQVAKMTKILVSQGFVTPRLHLKETMDGSLVLEMSPKLAKKIAAKKKEQANVAREQVNNESVVQTQVEEVNVEKVEKVHKEQKIVVTYPYSKSLDILNKRLEKFLISVSPTISDYERRQQVIERIEQIALKKWKKVRIYVFGSFSTGLFLPSSDLDLMISTTIKRPSSAHVKALAKSILKDKDIAKEGSVIPLPGARVPIIKMTDARTGIDADISFNLFTGVTTARLISEWIDMTPQLKELVLILKQYLIKHELNNPAQKGLGGFSLICMVYCFLRNHPRNKGSNTKLRTDDLGMLLIQFFKFYGTEYNYDEVAILFNGRQPMFISTQRCQTPEFLILDPHDIRNNLAASTKKVSSLKKSFAAAYSHLDSRCRMLDEGTLDEAGLTLDQIVGEISICNKEDLGVIENEFENIGDESEYHR